MFAQNNTVFVDDDLIGAHAACRIYAHTAAKTF